jgi:hypothetical protein
MNTKALITVLALVGSTSSLAMARPATQYSASASARASWSIAAPVRVTAAPTVRDHRVTYVPPAPVVIRHVAPRYDRDSNWTSSTGWGYRQPRATILADGLTYNTGEYRKDIVLEGRGRFNTLVLNEQGGCNFIKEVRIEFLGGAVQSIPVNRNLTGNQSMTFELDGTDRPINRIFVYRDDGALLHVGSPSDGEFTVTAL